MGAAANREILAEGMPPELEQPLGAIRAAQDTADGSENAGEDVPRGVEFALRARSHKLTLDITRPLGVCGEKHD